jgi:hypothetical protein
VSTRPDDVGPVGELIYQRVAPLAFADEQLGWALLILCGGLGKPHDLVHELVSDDADGDPGWSALLDPDRCPAQLLPFLAQCVGERIPAGETEEAARERCRTPQGMVRGTNAAIRAAAQRTLTGTKTVQILERTSSAYTLTVITLTAETPDPDRTERDLLAAKPAGLILTHVVTDDAIVDALAGTVDALAGTVNDL